MIRGTPRVVSGKLIEFGCLGAEYGPGVLCFEMFEANLEMNASGLAEIEIPFVSGFPSLYQVVRGTGIYAPAANFDVTIFGKFGRLAGGTLSVVTATNTGDIVPTSVSGGAQLQRLCGPCVVRISNSNASNNTKRVIVAMSVGLAFRNYST